MTAGERIRDLRKQRGWSQKKLHQESGVAEITIRTYENSTERQPRLEQLQKIAYALETTTAYLLGEDDDPRPIIIDPDLTQETLDRMHFKLGAALEVAKRAHDSHLRLQKIFAPYGITVQEFDNLLNEYDKLLGKYNLTQTQFYEILDALGEVYKDAPNDEE